MDIKTDKAISPKDIIKAIGLVFGDIGTSPIYTVTVVFLLLPVTVGNIIRKTFALIKRITPAFIQFYNFPSKKLHGVITKVAI